MNYKQMRKDQPTINQHNEDNMKATKLTKPCESRNAYRTGKGHHENPKVVIPGHHENPKVVIPKPYGKGSQPCRFEDIVRTGSGDSPIKMTEGNPCRTGDDF